MPCFALSCGVSRFEDNMKAMYRPAGRGQASEGDHRDYLDRQIDITN